MYKYRFITLPFSKSVKDLSKEEAKQYFDWFLQQIPIRITQLNEYINRSKEYETWTPDNSPESLIQLGEWFSKKISSRIRTYDEIQEIYSTLGKFQGVITIPNKDLSHESFSLAFDIGMYLSQVLLNNVPDLHWELMSKPKNSVFYNHPIIKSTGKMICDPVHLSIIFAYGLIKRTRQASGLNEIYKIWSHDFIETPY